MVEIGQNSIEAVAQKGAIFAAIEQALETERTFTFYHVGHGADAFI